MKNSRSYTRLISYFLIYYLRYSYWIYSLRPCRYFHCKRLFHNLLVLLLGRASIRQESRCYKYSKLSVLLVVTSDLTSGGFRPRFIRNIGFRNFCLNSEEQIDNCFHEGLKRGPLDFHLLSISVTSPCPESTVEELGIKNWPIWTCEVSSFDCIYDDKETFLSFE